MAKKNGQAAPAAATPTPASPAGPITKMEAVRRALAAMGNDATPSQMQPWIKEQFGIEMSTDHISTYKGDILRKAKAKGKGKGGKKAAAPKAAPAPAPAAAREAPVSRRGPGPAGGSIRFEDVQTTKDLVDRLGAERLRVLIALFAR